MRNAWPVSFLQFSPWHVEEGAAGCADDQPYGVVADDTDEVVGCHATEADAEAQVAALYANEPEADETAAAAEVPFTAVVAVEGFETADGRLLEVGGWNEDSRFLPLPLWVQTEQPEWGGHAGAFIGGRITALERADDGRRILSHGFVSTADERGRWAESQIRSQNLRFVSIDVGETDVEHEVRAVDEDGWPIDVLARFSNYQIAGATVCGQPAITFATIWLDGMDPPAEFTAPLPIEPERVDDPEVVESDGVGVMLLASGARRDDDGHPPAEWFEDPELPSLTHITVTDADEVFGHLAPWGECHIGMPGCVTAPASTSDYAHFRSGETLAWCDCEDGEHVLRVATGPITLGTGHAARGLTARESAWHYDHTGSVVADVAVGEDEHGIWIHGAVRPGITDTQRDSLRAADVSGDWRRIGGQLELVAVLGVNVAGFSIPRQPQSHLVASGDRLVQTSLVAPVGTPLRRRHITDDPRIAMLTARMGRIERELGRLTSIAEPLRAMAAAEIVASIARHPAGDDHDS